MQFVRVTIDVVGRAPKQPTVLVISEDPDWRAVLRRVLEQEGYRVLDARHAGHALIASMRHEGTIDLLLTDGAQGRRRSDFAPKMFSDNPAMRLVHLEERPRTRDDLLKSLRHF